MAILRAASHKIIAVLYKFKTLTIFQSSLDLLLYSAQSFVNGKILQLFIAIAISRRILCCEKVLVWIDNKTADTS
jgi:hypothetical protein